MKKLFSVFLVVFTLAPAFARRQRGELLTFIDAELVKSASNENTNKVAQLLCADIAKKYGLKNPDPFYTQFVGIIDQYPSKSPDLIAQHLCAQLTMKKFLPNTFGRIPSAGREKKDSPRIHFGVLPTCIHFFNNHKFLHA